MYNFRLQKLKIKTFDWWPSYWYLILLKFYKYKDIIRKYNLMVDLSKFTFNNKK